MQRNVFKLVINSFTVCLILFFWICNAMHILGVMFIVVFPIYSTFVRLWRFIIIIIIIMLTFERLTLIINRFIQLYSKLSLMWNIFNPSSSLSTCNARAPMHYKHWVHLKQCCMLKSMSLETMHRNHTLHIHIYSPSRSRSL